MDIPLPGPGERQRLTGPAKRVCLVRHACQHVRAQHPVLRRLRQPQRLNQIPLGEAMPPVVVGHPPHQVRQLRRRLKQRLLHPPAAVVTGYEGQHVGVEVVHQRRVGVPATAHHVHLLKPGKHAADALHLAHTHLPRAALIGHLRQGGEHPVPTRRRQRGENERRSEDLAAVHVSPSHLGDRAQGGGCDDATTGHGGPPCCRSGWGPADR